MNAPDAPQSFKSVVTKTGGRVLVALPFDPDTTWGEKERHHVTGTINGHPYRGPLGSHGAGHFIALGEAWRRDTGVVPGTSVDVVLRPEGPQRATLAPDIASALAAEPDAQAFFEGLATFYRNNYVRWIEGAKRPETRAARIAEAVALLKAERKQK
jgi:hypothetical protein